MPLASSWAGLTEAKCTKCERVLPMAAFPQYWAHIKDRVQRMIVPHCRDCRRAGIRLRNIGAKRVSKKVPHVETPKAKARHKLRGALIHGRIIKKPCEVCGNPKSEGHHPDYSKPLEVIWLCRKHHAELNRKPGVLIELRQAQGLS